MATALKHTLTRVGQSISTPRFTPTAAMASASNLFVVNSQMAAVSDTDDPYEIIVGGAATFPAIRIFNSQGWPYLRLWLVTALSGAPGTPAWSTQGKFKAYSVQSFDPDLIKELPSFIDTTNFDAVDHASVGGAHCLPLLDPRSFLHEQAFSAAAAVHKDSTASSGHAFVISEPVLLLPGPAEVLVVPTVTPVATNEAKHMIIGQLSSY